MHTKMAEFCKMHTKMAEFCKMHTKMAEFCNIYKKIPEFYKMHTKIPEFYKMHTKMAEFCKIIQKWQNFARCIQKWQNFARCIETSIVVAGCTYSGTAASFAGIGSIISMTTIAYDRYVMVTFPMQSVYLGSTGRSLRLALFVWCYSAVFAILPNTSFVNSYILNG